jgi:hypothetical protein
MTFDSTSVINTAIGALPSIISLIKSSHAAAQPDAPALTDDQVIAALHDAVVQTLAIDEADEARIRAEKPDIGSDVPGGGAV